MTSPKLEFDAPDRQHGVAVDAVFGLDLGEQRRKFLGACLAGDNPPVGDPAVDILPECLVEFGLRADLGVDSGIGLDRPHHPRIGRLRHAAPAGARAKAVTPGFERCAGALRPHQRGRRKGGAQSEECPRQEGAAADGLRMVELRVGPMGHVVATSACGFSTNPMVILTPHHGAMCGFCAAVVPEKVTC